MLQMGTHLSISDNSGARKIECIKVLNKHPKASAFLGDLIVISVNKLRRKGNIKVKRKDICLCVIFRTKYRKFRLDGRSFNFFDNSGILLSRNFKPYATRLFGPIVKELRRQKKLKMVSLGSKFL